jgi:anaerobic selenocysteine-containing dehydrogenase
MLLSERDSSTGMLRSEVLISPEDLRELGLREEDEVVIRSEVGEMHAVIKTGDVHPRTVIAYWPECNVLIRRGVADPNCGIPAYRDQLVRVEKAS